MKNKEITVLDQEIHINKDDYFSLTDIARYICCKGDITFLLKFSYSYLLRTVNRRAVRKP